MITTSHRLYKKESRDFYKDFFATTLLDECPRLAAARNKTDKIEEISIKSIREWITSSATAYSGLPGSTVNLKNVHEKPYNTREDKYLSDLQKDGIAIIKDFINPNDLHAIQKHLNSAEAIKKARRQINSKMGNLVYITEQLDNLTIEEKNEIDQIILNIAKIWNQRYSNKLENVMSAIHGFNVKENCKIKDITQIQSKFSIRGEDDWEDRVTCWHIDRFVPVFKAFFFPFPCDTTNAPFGYALRSHIINDEYIETVSNLLYNRVITGQMIGWRNNDFDYKEIEVDSNTLVIAATNGMHRRTPFKTSSWRHTLRFNFYNSNTIRANLHRQLFNSYR